MNNPLPPPDVDLDKLRGDRIGDTVYSGKWCIQTIMKLMQSNVVRSEECEEADDKTELVDMEEELQNEVGVLWDMTSNLDVCQYLHSISAIESICYVINNSRCPRATEMCVGMLANIITHKELWDILKNDNILFDLLIQLLSNTDQPVLLEVTRFLNTALCHVDNESCYARLCENGPGVTSELVRILSGSTNGELLKHAAELSYNLMYIDDGETKYCAFFSQEPDFVLAIVEASKELGYEHECQGQEYLMEIFHCFTTYEAGIAAIENCMEQIAEANSSYLKSLCKNVNLSNHSTIITTIIATLNHIFCRNVVVRLGLMSSPTFAHCILKTLVAVYRKLGCYKSIAYPKGSVQTSGHSKHTNTSSTTWQVQDESGFAAKSADTSSWSERANTAVSQSAVFRTPDPSPVHVHRAKELDVSWSERRISSPLAEDDLFEERWKRPHTKKTPNKKKIVIETSRDRTLCADKSEPEGSELDNVKTITETVPSEERESNAKKIDEKCRHNTDGERTSKGFSPRDEDMDTGRSEEFSESEVSESLASKEGTVIAKSPKSAVKDSGEPDCPGQTELDMKFNSSSDEENEDFDNSDDSLMQSFDAPGGDKYHKLLSAIKEFLTDYLNNMRETVCTDDGTPYLTSLIKYLNSQCSGTEIRGLIRCVGSSTDVAHPLGRLLHLADYFQATKLKSVLLGTLEAAV
ncbi:uncharacterized protein LOC106074702 isoform X2 [Biomphalaria glabrata]|nr:uncharacterized protein LOC106074702 isoform X2 [Biomphalaria glabrata]